MNISDYSISKKPVQFLSDLSHSEFAVAAAVEALSPQRREEAEEAKNDKIP